MCRFILNTLHMVEGDRSEAPHQQIDAENINPTDDLSAVDKLIH
jgi:hypothetical protein